MAKHEWSWFRPTYRRELDCSVLEEGLGRVSSWLVEDVDEVVGLAVVDEVTADCILLPVT